MLSPHFAEEAAVIHLVLVSSPQTANLLRGPSQYVAMNSGVPLLLRFLRY